MKTNVSIQLTDEQRNLIACKLDGKVSKRKISRIEVTTLCNLFIESFLDNDVAEVLTYEKPPSIVTSTKQLDSISKEDRDILKGKDIGYVRGWNKVKLKLGSDRQGK